MVLEEPRVTCCGHASAITRCLVRSAEAHGADAHSLYGWIGQLRSADPCRQDTAWKAQGRRFDPGPGHSPKTPFAGAGPSSYKRAHMAGGSGAVGHRTAEAVTSLLESTNEAAPGGELYPLHRMAAVLPE